MSRFEIEPMDNSGNSTMASCNSNASQSPTRIVMPEVRLRRSEMNALVMDYLIYGGFKEAAERFSEEAGIEPSGPLAATARMTPESDDDLSHIQLRLKTSNSTNYNANNGNSSVTCETSTTNNNVNNNSSKPTNSRTTRSSTAAAAAARAAAAYSSSSTRKKGNSFGSDSSASFGKARQKPSTSSPTSSTTSSSTHSSSQSSISSNSSIHPMNIDHESFNDTYSDVSFKQSSENKTLMTRRIEVRQLIQNGDILSAKTLINTYYPEMLDTHRNLYFKLQQQHLIELIRQQKINEVLAYVHDQLSLTEKLSKDELNEMERTLALLAYDNPLASPYADLLSLSHRLQTADEVNDVILMETLGNVEPPKPHLVTLLKLLHWTQSELDRNRIPYEKLSNLFDDQHKISKLDGENS